MAIPFYVERKKIGKNSKSLVKIIKKTGKFLNQLTSFNKTVIVSLYCMYEIQMGSGGKKT